MLIADLIDELASLLTVNFCPTPYVHVVFTLPRELAPLALQNKKFVYDLLFRTTAETLLEVARCPALLVVLRRPIIGVLNLDNKPKRHILRHSFPGWDERFISRSCGAGFAD
jgi:hypothetical protein